MRRIALTLLCTALLLLTGGWMTPADAGDTQPPGRLASDDTVRSAMNAIRAAVVDHHTLITHRRLPKSMALGLASKVRGSIAAIRESSELSAEAKTALEPLLSRIQSGAEAIGSTSDSLAQMDGLFLMTAALDEYGDRFDHPGWTPVQAR